MIVIVLECCIYVYNFLVVFGFKKSFSAKKKSEKIVNIHQRHIKWAIYNNLGGASPFQTHNHHFSNLQSTQLKNVFFIDFSGKNVSIQWVYYFCSQFLLKFIRERSTYFRTRERECIEIFHRRCQTHFFCFFRSWQKKKLLHSFYTYL